jgi:Flp pilus assembly CpaF family ATPase
MSKRDLTETMRVLHEHLGQVQQLLDRDDVNEVMVNRHDSIFVEQRGQMELAHGLSVDPDSLSTAITMITNINKKPHGPLLDARLPGVRIAAAREPVAVNGDMLCIRKHAVKKRTLRDYTSDGAFNVLDASQNWRKSRDNELLLKRLRQGGDAIEEFLRWVIVERINVVVSGGTSSGKTTLLNAMFAEIPDDQRAVSIEDTAELKLDLPNYISLEANHEVTLRQLVKFSLRCRPDRILVGEVRGAEAFDLMEALNTGHEGSAVSYHSDSSRSALPRLESMVRMSEEGALIPVEDLRRQIANTFRFVVHAERHNGVRGPVQIMEILGVEGGRYKTRLLFSKYQLEESQYAVA